MSNLVSKLDKLLGSQMSVDYWSDEGIGIAAAIAIEFQTADWEKLADLIDERNSIWRSRCAESLGDEVSENAADLLLKLMRDSDQEVAICALDSLNSLAQLGLDLASSKDAISSVLSRFPEQPGGVTNLMISRLRNRLANS